VCFCFNLRDGAVQAAQNAGSCKKGKRMRHLWWLWVPAVAALIGPVQARPRDDALASAFRCAAIGDSRQWLECYYGSAQPVRAALGLAPALDHSSSWRHRHRPAGRRATKQCAMK